jgi:hypothetical protein
LISVSETQHFGSCAISADASDGGVERFFIVGRQFVCPWGKASTMVSSLPHDGHCPSRMQEVLRDACIGRKNVHQNVCLEVERYVAALRRNPTNDDMGTEWHYLFLVGSNVFCTICYKRNHQKIVPEHKRE